MVSASIPDERMAVMDSSVDTPSRPPRLALRFAIYTVEARQTLSRLGPGQHGGPWSVGPVLVTPASRCG